MSSYAPKHVSIFTMLAIFAIVAATMVLEVTNARATVQGDGIVKVGSAYGVEETVQRLQKDIATKGIMFFTTIDQAKLAHDFGIKLRPSTLLIFGNPQLGTQFITANPNAGLDWPVRLLVSEDEAGAVWVIYTDFQWIADRHGIKDRGPQFQKASEVIASITSVIAPSTR